MNDFLNSYANSNNLTLLKTKQNCTMITDYIQSIISRILRLSLYEFSSVIIIFHDYFWDSINEVMFTKVWSHVNSNTRNNMVMYVIVKSMPLVHSAGAF